MNSYLKVLIIMIVIIVVVGIFVLFWVNGINYLQKQNTSQHQLNTTFVPSYNINLESVFVENKTYESIQDDNLQDFKPVLFQTIGNETHIAQFEGLNAYAFNPNASAYYLVIQTPASPFILDTDGMIKNDNDNIITKYIPDGKQLFHSYYPYQEFFLLNKTSLIKISEQPKDMMDFPPSYTMYVFLHNPIPDYSCDKLNQYIKDHDKIKSDNYEIQAMNTFETKCLQRNNVK